MSIAPAPNVPAVQLSLRDEVAGLEVNTLPDEVARYLVAVATFELEGCAPTWRPESLEHYGRAILAGTGADNG